MIQAIEHIVHDNAEPDNPDGASRHRVDAEAQTTSSPTPSPAERPSAARQTSPAARHTRARGPRTNDTPPTPFPRCVSESTPLLVTDEILPSGTLLAFVSVDVLNAYINYVELRAVVTERDPDEEDRHISMSNRFYTHFHEFGTVIHVIASSARHWWYFCYDIDASDCAIGRVEQGTLTLNDMVAWVYRERVSKRYPIVEIDVKNLQGWRSFQ